MAEAQAQLNESILEPKLSELEQARTWSPRAVSRLENFIRTANDYDLFRVNPFQYAAQKGISETEAINLFLYATKFGLFEMDWQLACAYCPQVVSSFRELSKLHGHFVCSFCRAENDVALDDYIQVTFTISPQIRDNMFFHPDSLSVQDFYFRYNFAKGILPPPGMTMEQLMMYIHRGIGDIQPHEKQSLEFELTPGRFEIIDLAHNALLVILVEPGQAAVNQNIQVQILDGKFNLPAPETSPKDMKIGIARFKFDQVGHLAPGKYTFELENLTETRGRYWIIQYPPGFEATYQQYEPFLTGKKLLTTQTFRDLFRSEVINASEGLTVKDITFLFTDLKGSTELYDRIGDTKAYFLVRQHFEALSKAISSNSGAIVKTIGDAVMATFERPADAVAAAIMMIEEIEAFNNTISQELVLKIGIHRGHSIAVTSNDRIDYFGQTVNIAARVQGLANAGEIYLTNDVYDVPEVAKLLKAHEVTSENVSVKGVSEKLHVHKLTVRKS